MLHIISTIFMSCKNIFSVAHVSCELLKTIGKNEKPGTAGLKYVVEHGTARTSCIDREKADVNVDASQWVIEKVHTRIQTFPFVII